MEIIFEDADTVDIITYEKDAQDDAREKHDDDEIVKHESD